MKYQTFFPIILLIILACSKSGHEWRIIHDNQRALINSGILSSEISLDKYSAGVTMHVKSDTLFTGTYYFSFALWKADPNKEPQGIETVLTNVEQKASVKNQTDALYIQHNNNHSLQSVQWIDSLMIYSKDKSLQLKAQEIKSISEGSLQLTLTYKVTGTKYKGMLVEMIYEIYDGYPVIRQRINFINKSKNWIKITHLNVFEVKLNNYFTTTHLTPKTKEIDPSIIALGNGNNARGIIIGSEMPSRLRLLNDRGIAGYHPDYFEWIVGPNETFESEPVFLYAFSGNNFNKNGMSSTALDRCVEKDFRNFLKEKVLLQTNLKKMVAPLFCTWTNYGANINDSSMRQAADIASRIGFNCFQIDAGWSKTSNPNQWGISTICPDTEKFPDMKRLNLYIRSKNMMPGLWYSVFMEQEDAELEKVPLFSVPMVKRAGGLGISFAYKKGRNKYVNDIVYLNKTYGTSYFKQDLSNICYGDLAKGHESRTLKESYLRGLRGLLASQDKIHQMGPEIVLQLSHEIYWSTPGPPGDIAVLKHADLYHSSPNEYWGAGMRGQLVNNSWNMNNDSLSQKLIEGCFRARKLWYDHRGLPLERIEVFGASITNYKGSLTPQIQDRQICSWLMGAPLSFSGDLTSLTTENIERYRDRFAIVNTLQKKYNIYSHFQYSGVPTLTDEGWHWWGKLNNQGYGAVVILRGNGGVEKQSIYIPWVFPDSRYHLKALLNDADLGYFTGKELQGGAVTLSLQKYGQEIIELSK